MCTHTNAHTHAHTHTHIHIHTHLLLPCSSASASVVLKLCCCCWAERWRLRLRRARSRLSSADLNECACMCVLCVCMCSWGWLCMHVLVGVIVYACVSLIWLLACMQVCYCVYGSVRVSDCVQVRVLRGQASQNARAQIIVFYDTQVTISYKKKPNFK